MHGEVMNAALSVRPRAKGKECLKPLFGSFMTKRGSDEERPRCKTEIGAALALKEEGVTLSPLEVS